jgi:hypothetical protein
MVVVWLAARLVVALHLVLDLFLLHWYFFHYFLVETEHCGYPTRMKIQRLTPLLELRGEGLRYY